MRPIRRLCSYIDAMSRWSGKGVSFLLVGLVLALTYEVVLRYVFNSPTFWAYDTSMYVFGFVGMIAGAYVLLRREHVNLDLVYGRLSPRKKAIVDSVTALVFFFFVFLVVWQGGIMALHSLAVREKTLTVWHPPVYPFKMIVPIAGCMLLLQGISNFIRDLYFAIRGKELS